MRAALSAAVATVLVLSACGGGEPAGTPASPGPGVSPTATAPSPTTSVPRPTTTAPSPAPAGPALTQQCTHPQAGYRIHYPEGWSTNQQGVLPTCELFDPEPIQIEPGTEVPEGIAVQIRRADIPFEAAVPGEDERGMRILERRETQIAGRQAVAILFEATPQAPLLEPGTRGYQYFVDADGGTVIATTYSVGELDFARKQEILDAMMATLELVDGAAPAG